MMGKSTPAHPEDLHKSGPAKKEKEKKPKV
jgi:hypothetical protein